MQRCCTVVTFQANRRIQLPFVHDAISVAKDLLHRCCVRRYLGRLDNRYNVSDILLAPAKACSDSLKARSRGHLIL